MKLRLCKYGSMYIIRNLQNDGGVIIKSGNQSDIGKHFPYNAIYYIDEEIDIIVDNETYFFYNNALAIYNKAYNYYSVIYLKRGNIVTNIRPNYFHINKNKSIPGTVVKLKFNK